MTVLVKYHNTRISTDSFKLTFVHDEYHVYEVLKGWISRRIKTHGSESRGQGGSTLRRPLDKRT